MKRIITALALSLLTLPAYAEMEYSLPVGYESLVLSQGGQTQDLRGVSVPFMWFGGDGKHLGLKSTLGYAYLSNGSHYAALDGHLDLHFPIGFIAPAIGVMGSYWVPVSHPAEIQGQLATVGPFIGLTFDLGLLLLQINASYGPVWGLSHPQNGPYQADITRIGAKAIFGF